MSMIERCTSAYFVSVGRHAEANEKLWKSNLFSFNDAESFRRFMGTRSPTQKRLLRKLRLAVDWASPFESERSKLAWYSALNMRLVKSLQGLREVWLDIAQSQKSEQTAHPDHILSLSRLDGIEKLLALRELTKCKRS